jgi:hypothetical protein
MRTGASLPLTSKYKNNPAKEAKMRGVTREISERNAVRILVNSTGAFPMHPEKQEPKKDG